MFKSDSKKIMKHKYCFFSLLLLFLVMGLAGCQDKPVIDGEYDFIIYESDSDNSDLSDNPIVAKYHIQYVDCKTVSDTLIKKGDSYYFSEDSEDYLVLVNSAYGLSYKDGYFKNYYECADGNAIDISWSYTAVNGDSASYGIGETPLEGLIEYGLVINGWK